MWVRQKLAIGPKSEFIYTPCGYGIYSVSNV